MIVAWFAFSCALLLALALTAFGTVAVARPGSRISDSIPYFVFACISAFAAAGDFLLASGGDPGGNRRVVRHLWRMSLALFFATAFFFIGQQKVMPVSVQGSPVLLVVGFAPLCAMAFWLWRLRRAAPKVHYRR